jgi:hypothetical protein
LRFVLPEIDTVIVVTENPDQEREANFIQAGVGHCITVGWQTYSVRFILNMTEIIFSPEKNDHLCG